MGGVIGIVGEYSVKHQSNHSSDALQTFTRSITASHQLQLQQQQHPIQPKKHVIYHPELRKLRLILTCDYGRPKFIKFLFHTVPICCEILREQEMNVMNFISNFQMVEDLSENLNEISHSPSLIAAANLPIQLLVNGCLTNILVLVGMTYFHLFTSSSEGEDWVRYQQLLTNTNHGNVFNDNSMSESTRALSQARSHALVQCVNYDEIIALMNQPLWLVTLARTFDTLPFPISIHGTRNKRSAAFPLLYANLAYLDMSGYTAKQVIETEYNLLDDPTEIFSRSSSLILDALKNGTALRLGKMNHRAKGEKFQNFMTLKPLCDMSDGYKFMIIVHCDLTTRGTDHQYLHKINLFAETIVPSQIYCSELDSSDLSDYFCQTREEASRQG